MTDSMTHSESIQIAASPSDVYAVVSDVTRTGEWSPVCKECWWDSEEDKGVGAWFTGRNVLPDRTWETRSQITTAKEGTSFGWSVGPGRVNWTYEMREVDGGTELTETWEFTPEGLAAFAERYGDDALAQIEARRAGAQAGIEATLAAMKKIIEQG